MTGVPPCDTLSSRRDKALGGRNQGQPAQPEGMHPSHQSPGTATEPPRRILVSAPGKVILFGEHAVVHQKTAVAASLGLGSYLYLERRDDPCYSLNLPDVGIQCEWQANDLPRGSLFLAGESSPDGCDPNVMSEGLRQQLEKVADGVLKTKTREQTDKEKVRAQAQKQAILAFLYLLMVLSSTEEASVGFTLHVHSYLPVSAGLGSSASYAVVLAAALLIHFGQIPASFASNPDMLEKVNRYALKAEKIIHGNPSGVDNAVATYGGAITFVKGEPFKKLDGFQSLRLLLTHTKIPRSTSVLVAGVGDRKSRYPNAVDPILAAIDGVSLQCRDAFGEFQKGRLERSALQAILGDLIDINHGLLRALGVSHASLEKVIAITATRHLKTKLTGAGGGGCAVSLIPDAISVQDVESLMKDLKVEGFDCFDTSVGGPGVRAVILDDDTKNLVWMRTASQPLLESCFL